MDLLSEVFSDLIKDLNTWSEGTDKASSEKEALIKLKETLQEQIDGIDSELRFLNQDSSWAGVDEAIEESKIENLTE